MKLDIRLVAAGVFVVVAIIAGIIGQQLRGSDQPVKETNNGPVATLPGSTEPTDVAEEPKKQSVSADVEAAQTKAAEDFVKTYFAYSYRDANPNAFLNRAKQYMTASMFNSTGDSFKDDDAEVTVEWSDIRSERRIVNASVVNTELDPWYTASTAKAIVAVTFQQSTSDNIGSGGTGEEQTQRLVVVKVGSKYLVNDFFYTGTDD